MATLPESAIFEEGIFQLEKSTPPLGGAPIFSGSTPTAGHANAQAAQLANRTQWLREQINSKYPAFTNYAALRSYTGTSSEVRVTDPYIFGNFYYDSSDTTSLDNGATTIVTASGLRYKRRFVGNIQIGWFGVIPGDTLNRYSDQFQSAIDYTRSISGTLEGSGDIYIDKTLVLASGVKYNLDFKSARIMCDQAMARAIDVGTVGANPYRGKITGLRFYKTNLGTGDVAWNFLNIADSKIDISGSTNFSKAFNAIPNTNSRVAYTVITDPIVVNHEYGLYAKPQDSGSYVNGLEIRGGRFASFVAGRLIDHAYLDNEFGSGVQHNKLSKVSIEGYSSSGFCGKSAVRCINGANQNVFEWCRTEKYNDGWQDATYVFDTGTNGNTLLDTRSDTTIIDNGSNNWWTPTTGFHFNGFVSNAAAMPAFKYTRNSPLSNTATKYAIDITDTYSPSGEVGFLKYSSARGGGTLIDITTTLGSMRMNGQCEWTTPSKRSGAVTGASSHGYSVAADVTGATLCAAYHSLKNSATGNWFIYGEGTAPSYFGGPIRTVGTNNITPATTFTGALFFSNTSSNTGAVASEYQTNNTANRHHISFSNPNGVVGSISTNGSATTYNTSSDLRLKENVSPAEDSGPIIDAIEVIQFDWKVDGSHQDFGFGAQDLVKVAPYAVSYDQEDHDASWGIDYSKLVPVMMQELKKLRMRVKDLENKNAAN